MSADPYKSFEVRALEVYDALVACRLERDVALAENQRLREALEQLAEWPPESVEYSGETLRQFVMATRDMRAAAREALAGDAE